MNPGSLSALLDSLPKPEEGQAEELHGIKLSGPYVDVQTKVRHTIPLWQAVEHLEKRLEIAESLRVPEGLRESIKKAVLAGMRSAEAHENFMCLAHEDDVYSGDYEAWCALCDPDSTLSETNREEVKG